MKNPEESSEFNALSEKLVDLRKKSSVSLEELAEKSKISIQVLEALERGERKRLPEKVFVMGYIRIYCRLCQANSEETAFLLEQVARLIEPEKRKAKASSDSMQSSVPLKPPKKKKIRFFSSYQPWALCLFVLIVLGVLLLFGARNISSWLATKNPASAHKTTLLQKSELKPSVSVSQKSHAAKKAQPAEKIVEDSQALLSISKKVRIKYSIDEADFVENEYLPGKYSFSFRKQVEFIVANISAVSMILDGENLGVLGRSKIERHFLFKAGQVKHKA